MRQKFFYLIALLIMAVAGTGNLYSQGVTVFAGADGQSGTDNGSLTEARFNQPWGLAFDPTYKILYVTEWSSNDVRKIDLETGEVSTFIPTGIINFPRGITTDAEGNVFVTGYSDNKLYKATPAGEVSIVTEGLNLPTGVAVGDDGNYYVSNRGTNSVIQVTPTGEKSTHTLGFTGAADPYHIVRDGKGGFYACGVNVGDMLEVSSVADMATRMNLGFDTPRAGAVDASGTLYVIQGNGAVFKVVDGAKQLISSYGLAGGPYCLVVTPDGKYIYASNTDKHTIVKIDVENPGTDPNIANFYRTIEMPFTESGIYKDLAVMGWSGSSWNEGRGWLGYEIVLPTDGILYITDKKSPTWNLWWILYTLPTYGESSSNIADNHDGSITKYLSAGRYYLVGIINYGFSADYTEDENCEIEPYIAFSPFKQLTLADLPYTETGSEVASSPNNWPYAPMSAGANSLAYQVKFDRTTILTVNPGPTLEAYITENVSTGSGSVVAVNGHSPVDVTCEAGKSYLISLRGEGSSAYSISIDKSDHSFAKTSLPFAGAGKFLDDAVSVSGPLDATTYKPHLAYSFTAPANGVITVTDNLGGPCLGDSYFYFMIYDNTEKAGSYESTVEFPGSGEFEVLLGKTYYLLAIPQKWEDTFDKTLEELDYDLSITFEKLLYTDRYRQGYERDLWSVLAKNAQHAWSGTGVVPGQWYNGYPINILDNDYMSAWHTHLSAPRPYYFIVDMQESLDVDSILIIPGPQGDRDASVPWIGTGEENSHGYIMDVDVYITNTCPEMPEWRPNWGLNSIERILDYNNWREPLEQDLPSLAEGAPSDWGPVQASVAPGGLEATVVISLPTTVNGRYIICAIDKTNEYACVGDLRVLGSSKQTLGVKEIVNGENKAVKSVRYFDLMGRQVRSNATGLIIKQITYTDGTTGIKKQVVLDR
jgi:DNA-binding beta-propeller fold protein YncE